MDFAENDVYSSLSGEQEPQRVKILQQQLPQQPITIIQPQPGPPHPVNQPVRDGHMKEESNSHRNGREWARHCLPPSLRTLAVPLVAISATPVPASPVLHHGTTAGEPAASSAAHRWRRAVKPPERVSITTWLMARCDCPSLPHGHCIVDIPSGPVTDRTHVTQS
ncbi:uncharacterized protein [Narcine bancroftii]|uniref:uncharacterized protein isoform X3 n=1 Tax=Narcine bancroftii TaxID=1343680 RepID=UPI00383213C7